MDVAKLVDQMLPTTKIRGFNPIYQSFLFNIFYLL